MKTNGNILKSIEILRRFGDVRREGDAVRFGHGPGR
jgi:hypothetical protein